MSPASYRTAPPRVGEIRLRDRSRLLQIALGDLGHVAHPDNAGAPTIARTERVEHAARGGRNGRRDRRRRVRVRPPRPRRPVAATAAGPDPDTPHGPPGRHQPDRGGHRLRALHPRHPQPAARPGLGPGPRHRRAGLRGRRDLRRHRVGYGGRAACAALGDRGPDSQRRGTSQGARRPLVPDQDPGRPVAGRNPCVHDLGCCRATRARRHHRPHGGHRIPRRLWHRLPVQRVRAASDRRTSTVRRGPDQGPGPRRTTPDAALLGARHRRTRDRPDRRGDHVAHARRDLADQAGRGDARPRRRDPGLRAVGHLAQRPRRRCADPRGPQRAAAGRGG